MSPDQKPQERTFKLLPWFSLFSAVAILFTMVAVAFFLSRFISQVLLRHDAELMTQFVNGVVEIEDAHPFFITGHGDEESDIEEFLIHLSQLPDVLRANAYGSDGTIIWSSNAELIGRSFPNNDELKTAMTGQPVINLGTSGGEEKKEHVFFTADGIRFIENYLPIWSIHDEKPVVVGAVEVYRRPTNLFKALSTSTLKLWLSAAIVSMALFSILFVIVRQAARSMAYQQRRLLETESLATMGEMASAVAHGLRNPLASIRSSAELAMECDDRDEIRSLLNDVMAQSDRLEGWIRQYLSYARMDEHAGSHADLASLVTTCLDSFASQIERRNIVSHNQVSKNLPHSNFNPFILTQVVHSLLANAVEAMQGNGELTLRANVNARGDGIELTISDTGPGMSEQVLREAMKPFGTSKSGGLGLGLPLSRQILQRNGGDLLIDSEVGKGTSATIILPLAS